MMIASSFRSVLALVATVCMVVTLHLPGVDFRLHLCAEGIHFDAHWR